MNSQSSLDPLDLTLAYMPHDPLNIEATNDNAGSSRRAQGTQLSGSRSSVEISAPNMITEGTSHSALHVAPVAPPPPPPPLWRLPTFTCPICLGCIVEETSTSCGHIFCKVCIERALLTRAQCPMCRRKITHRGIHRIHFEVPL